MIEKKIEILVRGSEVTRFHTSPVLKAETVGHHSNIVAGLVIILFPNHCAVDIMKYAVFHDLAEFVTGDIPSPVKRMAPELKRGLDDVEKKVFEQYGVGLPLLSYKSAWVFKACDNISGILKLLREIGFGNSHAKEALSNYVTYMEAHISNIGTYHEKVDIPESTLLYINKLLMDAKELMK